MGAVLSGGQIPIQEFQSIRDPNSSASGPSRPISVGIGFRSALAHTRKIAAKFDQHRPDVGRFRQSLAQLRRCRANFSRLRAQHCQIRPNFADSGQIWLNSVVSLSNLADFGPNFACLARSRPESANFWRFDSEKLDLHPQNLHALRSVKIIGQQWYCTNTGQVLSNHCALCLLGNDYVHLWCCTSTVLALYQFCAGISLRKQCHGTGMVLLWYCACTRGALHRKSAAQTPPWHCPVSVLGPRWYCIIARLVLRCCCRGILLYWHHVGAALLLCKHCIWDYIGVLAHTGAIPAHV